MVESFPADGIEVVPEDWLERWAPDIGVVPAIAEEVSVNPRKFGKSTRSVGQGLLAVTPWGQKHGLSQRDLDNR
jgi:hypothetical protein